MLTQQDQVKKSFTDTSKAEIAATGDSKQLMFIPTLTHRGVHFKVL